MSEPENSAVTNADKESQYVSSENMPSKPLPAYTMGESIHDSEVQKQKDVVSSVAEALQSPVTMETHNVKILRQTQTDYDVVSGDPITLVNMMPSNITLRKRTLGQPVMTPIPSEQKEMETTTDRKEDLDIIKSEEEALSDDIDSISAEITDLPGDNRKQDPDSFDDAASGLSRIETRAMQVTRVMRNLFCCGVRIERPDEDEISTRSGFWNSGI